MTGTIYIVWIFLLKGFILFSGTTFFFVLVIHNNHCIRGLSGMLLLENFMMVSSPTIYDLLADCYDNLIFLCYFAGHLDEGTNNFTS